MYSIALDGSGRYRLSRDFAPPTAVIEPQFFTGTSANSYGGGGRAGIRATNQTWSFSLQIAGSSLAEIKRGLDELNRFLSLAGDENDPVYFAFRNHSIYPFEPIWGQAGAYLRLEVVFGRAEYDSSYGGYTQEIQGRLLPNCLVTLTVRPYALGLRQRLASAMGGIAEDVYGSVSGQSRGLQINEGTGNKLTNPVFGHPTWDNGWVKSTASLMATKNTNLDHVLFGDVSAKITNPGPSAAAFRQSIAAGNTNGHYITAYVKRADGGTVSASTCQLDYNGGIATTYYDLGNGFWRLTAGVTGVAGATPVGLRVAAGQTVYLCGMAFSETSHFTPITVGDFLGCAWSGVPHESASTRERGRVRIPVDDCMDNARGTIRVIWRSDASNAQYGAFFYYVFLVAATSNFYLRWDAANTRWQFSDGTTSISSSSTTFSSGQVHVFHCVYGAAGLSLYLNGSLIASSDTPYTPITNATYLYIGSDNSGTNLMRGAFGGFTTFGMGMTGSQVLQDYIMISPLALANEVVDPIPWLWTKDGDDEVDNCDDSSRDNWFVCGGIPGDTPAKTRYEISGSGLGLYTRFYLGGYAFERFIPPKSWYYDHSGSADATCSGGAYQSMSAGGAYTGPVAVVDPPESNLHYFIRLADSTGGLSAYPSWYYSTSNVSGSRMNLITSSQFRINYAGSMYYQRSRAVAGVNLTVYMQIYLNRSGGAANASVDYILVIPGDLLYLKNPSVTTGNIFIENNYAYISAGTNPVDIELETIGKAPDIHPGKFNTLWFILGGHGQTHFITDTATFAIYATPRWSIM